eukprot:SAG22_NODE_174_length_16466_cov_34.991568_3_plen_89_part_00
MFEYSCASRACHLGCPASTSQGCGKGCAKVRWPAIEARLRSQGFLVDYAQCVRDVMAGNRPAIYDVVMFAKRAGSGASTSARDQLATA